MNEFNIKSTRIVKALSDLVKLINPTCTYSSYFNYTGLRSPVVWVDLGNNTTEFVRLAKLLGKKVTKETPDIFNEYECSFFKDGVQVMCRAFRAETELEKLVIEKK